MSFGCEERIVFDQCLPPRANWSMPADGGAETCDGTTPAFERLMEEVSSAAGLQSRAEDLIGTPGGSGSNRWRNLLRGTHGRATPSLLTSTSFDCIDQHGRRAEVWLGEGFPIDRATIEGEGILCSAQAMIAGTCSSDRCADMDFPDEVYAEIERDDISRRRAFGDAGQIFLQMMRASYSWERGAELFRRLAAGGLRKLAVGEYDGCDIAIARRQAQECSQTARIKPGDFHGAGPVRITSIDCHRTDLSTGEDVSLEYEQIQPLRYDPMERSHFCGDVWK